ncbi:MAG: xylulokinase [Bryobacterales bacterium]|nr:xylulokinase [Bryobacterales bacterium]
MFWLGIDIGTGGTRALLLDEEGKVRHGFTAPHEEILMHRPLWAEQRPENWWDAAQAAVRGVLEASGASGDQVAAIGLSGQMHGLTLLDENNAVIRPALIWCDQRSQAQVDHVHEVLGRENVVRWTANPVLTGFTLPKLLWVRDHEPALFARIRRVLLPKDYIRFCLTGEYATEVSDASGTALLDVAHRRWSGEMIEGLKLKASILPRVYESPEITGRVTAAAAADTGLREGTPVVGGGGDQASSAVGNGVVEAGIASDTIGTSGVVFVHLDQPAYDPEGRVHTFCHAVPGKWHVMGVTQGAGLSLQWFRQQLAPEQSYDQLTALAATAPALSQGLYWLPYLMGERTPHIDARARAAWIGLTARHTRADMVRAVLEGVAYSQMDCLALIERMGARVEKVRLSGGGAKSPFWLRMFAAVFQKPVASLETQEGSAYGAGLLAMTGSGRFASVEESCRQAVRETLTVAPAADEAATYAQGYSTYTRLYPALKEIYPRL